MHLAAASSLLLLVGSHCAFAALVFTNEHHGPAGTCTLDYQQLNTNHGNADGGSTCVKIQDDVTNQVQHVTGLVAVSGPLSGRGDDAPSTVACPAGKILTSCRCDGLKCDGPRPHSSLNVCTVHNRVGGTGVIARANCVDAETPQGKFLQTASHSTKNAPTSTCPAGTALVDCSCWTPWVQSGLCPGVETISGNTCTMGGPDPGVGGYFYVWAVCLAEYTPPPPVCPQLDSEHLETEYEAFLGVDSTGFSLSEKDTFVFSVDVHNKYDHVLLTTGGAAGTEVTTVNPGTSITGQTPHECWSHYMLTIGWGALVDRCHFTSEGGPDGFLVFTCKVTVTADEDLAPLRGETLIRYMQWELPIIVKFPKQVSAVVGDLTAYQPPDVQAAIIRQEVDVNVASLAVDIDIRLYTSVQWPYRLKAAPADLTINLLAANFLPDPLETNAFRLLTDCADPGLAEPAEDGPVDAPCAQTWQLDIIPLAGALGGPCQLDGAYSVSYKAECHAAYASDCPLVADDLGQIQNEFRVDFVLDSEHYCPQVVDSVDLTATLGVYKDELHTIDATNFILGQMAYFLFDVHSDKVTVASTSISDMTFTDASGTSDVYLAGTELPNHGLVDLVVRNSDDAGVPADQVWVSFKVTDPPLSPPVDGSEDFSVDITCDVVFKNADGSLLLEKRSLSLLQREEFAIDAKSQPLAANAEVKMSAPDKDGDADTSSASRVAVGVAAAAATLALV